METSTRVFYIAYPQKFLSTHDVCDTSGGNIFKDLENSDLIMICRILRTVNLCDTRYYLQYLLYMSYQPTEVPSSHKCIT